MEAKKFISSLKSIRTRFTKNPNAEAEKKSIGTLVENFGGKLESIATLNEAGLTDLKEYLQGALGVHKVCPSVSTDEGEFAYKDGKLYKLDTVKKTMKRVYKDISAMDVDALVTTEMPMTVYQRYLKDKFPGEPCTIKKGKMMFRDYRISCDIEKGFIVEDTKNNYELVETPFEGIPTPKELGEWFTKPHITHTAEELHEAIERGKELARKAKEEREALDDEEDEAPDFEALRKKVLFTIAKIRNKSEKFDPCDFPNMIPFRRWKRKVNSLLTQWKNKKLRYGKFLDEVERVTEEEDFVVKEANHRNKFPGAILPSYNSVGALNGNKLEVDGKFVDAVPFLADFLLHHEKRAMPQLMKFAKGEITEKELFNDPLAQDWKVEYKKRLIVNSAHNAMVICMVMDLVGVTPPQDILYNTGLKEGDKVMIVTDDGVKPKTITRVDKGGAFLGKSMGYLLKRDRWYKVENTAMQ